MRICPIVYAAAGLAAILPGTALAQAAGSTGPGMPVLVGESDSMDIGVKTDAARARDAAARNALQDQSERSRRSRRDRAVAATAADLIAGAPIFDEAGKALGTIRSVDGPTAIVETGDSAVGVPVEAFGKNRNGLMLQLTKKQFDDMVAGPK
ncbi:hypothetical protein [Stakelama marina]|uniref:PRC-barrel domain-containing protein n=1 Tax=Stakelama marina TaxID=2826939 RepID=A0A8T4IJK7_9SPHN|nr:hypothetical protein [Stakelama marina]MBR0553295.1 hypothetical protein [Stakelama marina]